MTTNSDEVDSGLSSKPATLEDAVLAFTGAIGEAIPDVCTYTLIYGDKYIPFRPDEEEEEAGDDGEPSPCENNECDQLWVRVAMVTIAGDVPQSFGGSCEGLYQLDLEVGIQRCVRVEDDGEAPRANDLMVGAMQMLDDMQAIFKAAMGLEVWDSIDAGAWLPSGPEGGQYGGSWDFTAIF